MLTRKEIESMYDVQEETSLISSPGKFEAEPVYAPYFYDLAGEGLQDDVEYEGCSCDEDTECMCSPTDVFSISPDDITEFPELEGWSEVRLSYCDQGFVYLELR